MLSSRRRLLREAANRLTIAGIREAEREALRIWQDLADPQLSLGADYLVTGPDGPVEADVAEAFEAGVRRRAEGEPLAYVTGWVGFRRLILRCDRRALIPRPETEGLVDRVLALATTGRVAELGAGSGCLALALAQEGRFELVLAVERDRGALALARQNQQLTGLPVRLVLGSWAFPLRDSSVDVVVSNPPYLTAAEYEALDPSVRDWEPREALESGGDGLAATRQVLGSAARAVRPGGWVALELDSSRAGLVAGLAQRAGWQEVTVYEDLFGRARYLLAQRSSPA